jgi:hypothetical protein
MNGVPQREVHPVLDGLTPAQTAAATQPGAVLVLAGAGSGKTKALPSCFTDEILEQHRVLGWFRGGGDNITRHRTSPVIDAVDGAELLRRF